jgi:hypothetical protein
LRIEYRKTAIVEKVRNKASRVPKVIQCIGIAESAAHDSASRLRPNQVTQFWVALFEFFPENPVSKSLASFWVNIRAVSLHFQTIRYPLTAILASPQGGTEIDVAKDNVEQERVTATRFKILSWPTGY